MLVLQNDKKFLQNMIVCCNIVILMEYAENSTLKDRVFDLLNIYEQKNVDFQRVREMLAYHGFQSFHSYEFDEFIYNVIKSFMKENKIDNSYYEIIEHFFFDTDVTFEEYYNTYVERVNEDDINLTEEDFLSAKELIRKGIICCGCQIGSYLLNGKFESDVSSYTLQRIHEHPLTEDIHGKALDYSLVIQFINALISKLNDKFESRELFKSEVIGALGPYTFPETINKMYEPSPTGKAYEYYYIAGFSSNPSPTINECLKEMGLEKGMFSKAVRNHGFRVKDRFLSCSYGLGFRVVDLTNNQNIEEFIKKLGIQVDDICINLNEKNTMHK